MKFKTGDKVIVQEEESGVPAGTVGIIVEQDLVTNIPWVHFPTLNNLDYYSRCKCTYEDEHDEVMYAKNLKLYDEVEPLFQKLKKEIESES